MIGITGAPARKKLGEETMDALAKKQLAVLVKLLHLLGHLDEDKVLGRFGAKDKFCRLDYHATRLHRAVYKQV